MSVFEWFWGREPDKPIPTFMQCSTCHDWVRILGAVPDSVLCWACSTVEAVTEWVDVAEPSSQGRVAFALMHLEVLRYAGERKRVWP